MKHTPEQEPLNQAVVDMMVDRIDGARAEAREGFGFSPTLWHTLDVAGLTRLMVPEAAGGSGGSFEDLAVVLRVCGFYAAPVPIAETNLAAWSLSQAGQRVPPGPLTLAVDPLGLLEVTSSGTTWRATGPLAGVPWAATASSIVIVLHEKDMQLVGSICGPDLAVSPAGNIAHEPSADVRLPPGGTLLNTLPVMATPVPIMLSLTRAVLITGAARRTLQLTTQYAKARHQFGRPIAAFQAVGQQLAALAGAAEQADAMIDLAVGALSRGADASAAALAAKISADEAAQTAIRVGHQVHGAIGVTEEYELHHYTTRLMAWRDQGGSEAQANFALGQRVVSDPDALWALVAASSGAGR